MSFLESAMAFSKDMMGGLVVGCDGENGLMWQISENSVEDGVLAMRGA